MFTCTPHYELIKSHEPGRLMMWALHSTGYTSRKVQRVAYLQSNFKSGGFSTYPKNCDITMSTCAWVWTGKWFGLGQNLQPKLVPPAICMCCIHKYCWSYWIQQQKHQQGVVCGREQQASDVLATHVGRSSRGINWCTFLNSTYLIYFRQKIGNGSLYYVFCLAGLTVSNKFILLAFHWIRWRWCYGCSSLVCLLLYYVLAGNYSFIWSGLRSFTVSHTETGHR